VGVCPGCWCVNKVLQYAGDCDVARRGAGDQTGQESRSAGRRAATSVTGMASIESVTLEVAGPAAAGRFCTAAFRLGTQVRPTRTGSRGRPHPLSRVAQHNCSTAITWDHRSPPPCQTMRVTQSTTRPGANAVARGLARPHWPVPAPGPAASPGHPTSMKGVLLCVTPRGCAHSPRPGA
jgi:hypothetical protein